MLSAASLEMHGWRQTGRRAMAEKVGFEPTDRVTPVNALAGRPIRPLWHFSAGESTWPDLRTELPLGRSAHRRLVSLAGGTVAERTIAPALKADDPQGSEGSNPSRSAVASVEVRRCPRRSTEFCTEFGHVHRARLWRVTSRASVGPHEDLRLPRARSLSRARVAASRRPCVRRHRAAALARAGDRGRLPLDVQGQVEHRGV